MLEGCDLGELGATAAGIKGATSSYKLFSPELGMNGW
jgi:hypothetical protein